MRNHTETFTWTGAYRTPTRYAPWSLVVMLGSEALDVIPDPEGWEVRLDVPVGTEVTVDYLEAEE